MGRGPRQLTAKGWKDFLINKTDQQLYWWLRHSGYTRDYLKDLLIDADTASKQDLKGLSTIELIHRYKLELVEGIVEEMEAAW